MKLGRNDPCHCGSGKKYKYCHYEADQAEEKKRLQAAAEARRTKEAEAAEDGEEQNESGHGKHHDSQFFKNSGTNPHASRGKGDRGGTSRVSRGSQRGG